MTKKSRSMDFPIGYEFLDRVERAADSGSSRADSFARSSGERLPDSLQRFGTVMSLLYRGACCAWGCPGGDHQIEWLAGRITNEGLSSYRLMRAGFYDESLMLTRAIGELANLLWLFVKDQSQLDLWKKADRRRRLQDFRPAAVRRQLNAPGSFLPIDDERYQRLCEVGVHPTPGFVPGHYTGSGRAILGVVVQPVGVYVSVTELCYAVAMSALPISKLLRLSDKTRQEFVLQADLLIRALGAFNILNYNELLDQALDGSSN